MLAHLNSVPDGVDALQQSIVDLDTCFLHGFTGGQESRLASLWHIFESTPLHQRLAESIQALGQNAFSETRFVMLAAARSALQGTLYDVLWNHAVTVLGRTAIMIDDTVKAPASTNPLLDSVRHWLMELAITGFARLESDAVTSFSSTLAQLRANPLTAHQAVILTGFFHELLNALPVSSADAVPLLRWCDLWSSAMLGAVGIADVSDATSVSGTLYPLGVELRKHSRMASLVVYAVLLNDGESQFVRQSWSTFKASAIQGDDVWLLFPEAQMLLMHLLQGKAIAVQDMPMLPSGDLLWETDKAKPGKKFKLLDLALEHCGVGKPLKVTPVLPLHRHPVQLAEPIALTDFRVENDCLHLKAGTVLALDSRCSGLSSLSLEGVTALIGLLRYDAGEWSVQVLTAGNPIGKFEFIGQAGAELLKKPPKTSSVSVLQERASRLLRK